MSFTIYCHTHRDSGKKYVGQSCNGMHIRWRRHVSEAKRGRGSRAFTAAIREYGPEAFSHEVLEICESIAAACESEKKWILHFDCRVPRGYNIDNGGRGGGHRHAETKSKMSASAAARIAAMTHEERIAWARHFSGAISHEQRSANGKRNWERLTPEQKETVRKQLSSNTLTIEQRINNLRAWSVANPGSHRANTLARLARTSAEERTVIAKKIWATRHAKSGGPAMSQEALVVALKMRSGGALLREIAAAISVKLPTLYVALCRAEGRRRPLKP